MSSNTPGPAAETPEALYPRMVAAFQRRDLDVALGLADRILQITNGAGAAYMWAVRLRLETQRWQEAIDVGRQGLERCVGLIGLVGYAYEAIGDLEEAQRCFERACQEQPENSEWLFHNASVLSRLYRDFESMEVLQRGAEVSAAPDPALLAILAAQELELGEADKAVATATRALQLNPNVEGGHALVARGLMALGKFDEAEKRWSLAALCTPRDKALPFQRATALVQYGQFDLGIEALRKMLVKQPGFIPALVQIAGAKRMMEEDRPLIERMEEILADPRIGGEDRIALGYALGKSYDNLKSYEIAMKHFDDTNGLQFRAIEETGGFDKVGYAWNMAVRQKVYAREVTRELAAEGNPTEVPIFVLGMIRSGTTLAEQILSAHPSVAGAGELKFWINADLRLMDYERQVLKRQILREAGEAYLRLLNRFIKNGEARVVDKQPGNMILAAALHIAFPNARIIYMRRHPVDIAVSIWTTHLRTSLRFVHNKGNIGYAFRQHDKLMQHWREIIPPDRFMEISYESLVTDKERVTRQMLEFCGLPWSEDCLTPEKNKNFVVTPSLWQVRQPVYSTSVGRWKNYESWLGEFRELLESS